MLNKILEILNKEYGPNNYMTIDNLIDSRKQNILSLKKDLNNSFSDYEQLRSYIKKIENTFPKLLKKIEIKQIKVLLYNPFDIIPINIEKMKNDFNNILDSYLKSIEEDIQIMELVDKLNNGYKIDFSDSWNKLNTFFEKYNISNNDKKNFIIEFGQRIRNNLKGGKKYIKETYPQDSKETDYLVEIDINSQLLEDKKLRELFSKYNLDYDKIVKENREKAVGGEIQDEVLCLKKYGKLENIENILKKFYKFYEVKIKEVNPQLEGVDLENEIKTKMKKLEEYNLIELFTFSDENIVEKMLKYINDEQSDEKKSEALLSDRLKYIRLWVKGTKKVGDNRFIGLFSAFDEIRNNDTYKEDFMKIEQSRLSIYYNNIYDVIDKYELLRSRYGFESSEIVEQRKTGVLVMPNPFELLDNFIELNFKIKNSGSVGTQAKKYLNSLCTDGKERILSFKRAVYLNLDIFYGPNSLRSLEKMNDKILELIKDKNIEFSALISEIGLVTKYEDLITVDHNEEQAKVDLCNKKLTIAEDKDKNIALKNFDENITENDEYIKILEENFSYGEGLDKKLVYKIGDVCVSKVRVLKYYNYLSKNTNIDKEFILYYSIFKNCFFTQEEAKRVKKTIEEALKQKSIMGRSI